MVDNKLAVKLVLIRAVVYKQDLEGLGALLLAVQLKRRFMVSRCAPIAESRFSITGK